MRDVFDFLAACWSTGTLLRSVCALVIVPALAWLAVRIIAPRIIRLEHDPGWQAPLAAAAAAIPGALFVLLAVEAMAGGIQAACLETPVGRVLFATIILVGSFALGRALVLGGRRSGEASTLVRWSNVATGRLAVAAQRSGVTARTIEDERPFCALVGTWKPTIIVSSGAFSRLSDRELEAALLHERGHAHRGDQLVSAGLSFLVDLLPLPATDLVAVYRRAREIAADRHALQHAKPDDLAGALLTFAKSRTVATGSAALTGDGGVHVRLDLLLKDMPRVPVSIAHRAALVLALAAILGAGLAPASAAVLHPQPCNMESSHLAR